jgi:hypothetical protein
MKKVRTLSQAKADPRVVTAYDERHLGMADGGIWLYLARPWWCPDTDLAKVHEWNVRDLCRSLNDCYEAPDRWNAVYGRSPAEGQW